MLFLKIEKNVLFWKERRCCTCHLIKFSIQNLVLRVSGSILCFWWNVYQSTLVPHTPPQISGCASALKNYSFCITPHLKCLTVLWIGLLQELCSKLYSGLMLFTASGTLRIILVYSTLCFLGECRHIQSYSMLLRHNQAYLGIFSTLCNPSIFSILPYFEPWHI